MTLKCPLLFFLVPWLWFSVAFAQQPKLKFEHITSDDGLPQNTVHGIVKDRYGFMWFGTWGGLCRYDGYNFRVYKQDSDNPKSISSNRIDNLLKDEKGNIWILTFDTKHLCRYNYEQDNFDRITLEDAPLSISSKISRRKHYETINYQWQNTKWHFNTRTNELLQTDLLTGVTKNYKSNQTDPLALADDYVTDMYLDNTDILWLGTFSNGIEKANLRAKSFNYIYREPSRPNSIVDNNIRAICEDQGGKVWIGTRDKGISVIYADEVRNYTFANGLPDNQIRRIFCDNKGTIWVGTKTGVAFFNEKTNAFTALQQINTSVFGMAQAPDGKIIFATWQGVYAYDKITKQLELIGASNVLNSIRVRVVLFDKQQRLWVGTEGGGASLLTYNHGKLKLLRHFIHESKNKNSISENRINSIYEDSTGKIWIGTGNGLDCYDPSAKTIKSISGENGLADKTIAGILEDDQGFLWVSHKKGISRIRLNNVAIHNFTKQDGLQGNEFSDGAAYKSKLKPLIYFGGNNGYNAFNPKLIVADSSLPQTVLVDLRILNHQINVHEKFDDRIILKKPLYLSKKIELTAADKSFAIEFAGLHFSNPQANKYKYMLEGFDKDWISADADRRIASYSNLNPGTYVFKVISANNDGIWNTKPAVLQIVVNPPFYLSIWAYVVYTAVAIAIFALYHFYSTKYNRLQTELRYEQLMHEKENELNLNKQRFFTNISHEIKTPLSLILAPIENVFRRFASHTELLSQMELIKTNATSLLKLVNQLLDFERLNSGHASVNLKFGCVTDFLKNRTNAFKTLVEEKNICLTFTATETINCLFDDDKLEKIFNNLLSNAVKFTDKNGEISVNIISADGDFKIEVKNTGAIIPAAKLEHVFEPFYQAGDQASGGTGIGLAYCKTLVEALGGRIWVQSKSIEGTYGNTIFTVLLPQTQRDASALKEEEPLSDVFEPEVLENLEVQNLPNPLVDAKIFINGRLPIVLIVEDNPELRQYLCEHFKSFYRVLSAENGLEGLEVAKKDIPDLVISDVMMPEMDGTDFCAALKSDQKTAHIPLILLTAKSLKADLLLGLEMGADDYLTKPFELSVLEAKVRNLLLSREKLKNTYRKKIELKVDASLPQSADDKLIAKVMEFIDANLDNTDLNVDEICKNIGISRSQLYRKIKSFTGLSIAEVIKEMRLKKAKILLVENKFNVNEVAYMVGFSDADYFRKCFKAEFGLSPSEFAKQS